MHIKGLGYLIKEGFKNVWTNRIMSIASICVLISCLVMTGSAVLFSKNVQSVVDTIRSKNEATFYFDKNLSRPEAVLIYKNQISKMPNVEKVDFIRKDDALKSLKKITGDDIYDDLKHENNPLPDAVKVTFNKDIIENDSTAYSKMIKKILSIDGVDKVLDHKDFVERLISIDNIVRILSIVIVIALGVISLFIISNTIRATMFSRRFEISIMKSVGATNSFVRIPFIVEGMVIGLISAVLSAVGISFLYVGVMNIVSDILKIEYIPLENLIVVVSVFFVCAAMLIGALSGFISIRKYLKREGNEVLGW